MPLRLYARWAERHGYEAEIIEELRNGKKPASVTLTLFAKGENAYGYLLRGEAGVHRLVRISPFDSNARRQTSFAAVDLMPEIDSTIRDRDSGLRLEWRHLSQRRTGRPAPEQDPKAASVTLRTCRPASPPRGRTERSQHKNDDNAMNLLKAKLYQIEMQKQRAEVEKRYGEKNEVSFGSQIRNYTLQPYTLIKDVRTGVETGQVQAVLDGDIDDFIQAFLRLKAVKAHKAAKR